MMKSHMKNLLLKQLAVDKICNSINILKNYETFDDMLFEDYLIRIGRAIEVYFIIKSKYQL